MWLPDPLMRRCALLLLGLLGTALVLPGCTVRPLYAKSDMTAGLTGTQSGRLAGIEDVSIAPVTTRDAQQVRNQLIFLLNGGAREPAAARYTVALNVVTLDQSSASIQIQTDEEPTAAQIVMTSNYVITDNETGKPVTRGARQMVSSYDVPRQEFAVRRARIDAENRAARELAELLQLSITQDLLQVARTPVSPK